MLETGLASGACTRLVCPPLLALGGVRGGNHVEGRMHAPNSLRGPVYTSHMHIHGSRKPALPALHPARGVKEA